VRVFQQIDQGRIAWQDRLDLLGAATRLRPRGAEGGVLPRERRLY
jgi:hypothetical protein